MARDPLQKLTKRYVESLRPTKAGRIYFDSEVKGFGVRVWPSGRRVYLIQYLRAGRTRRMNLGDHGVLTVEEARNQAKQKLGQVAAGGDPLRERIAERARDLLFRDLAERYLEDHATARKKASSAAEDRRLLASIILPRLGSLGVSEVSRVHVGRLHQSLKRTPYQANRVLSLLAKMFALAERWGLRPDGSNPARNVERFAEQERKRYLSSAELARLGAALEQGEREGTIDPAAALAIRLLLLTGARKEEVLGLRWSEVSFERGVLELADSKTGAKTLAISAPVLALLDSAPRVQGNPYVIPGRKVGAHFVGLQKVWNQVQEAAGIERARLHDLRHTVASVGVSGGLSLPIVGALLGHRDTKSTARYSHVAMDPARAAANQIAGAIEAMLAGKDLAPVVDLSGRRRKSAGRRGR